MTTPAPPPPGRRDNGLPSADWGALVDLDPRLSEALLVSLADAGVPAYVEPAGGQNAITRASQLPARPLDRLWVDPVQADAARAVVGAEVAELTTLLAELEPGATAHGLVQPVPRSGSHRVLSPPELPNPPARRAAEAPPTAEEVASAEDAVTADAAQAPVEDDADAAWRRIVEGFDQEATSPVPPWPVSEDVDPPAPRRLPGSRPERSGEPGVAPRRRRRGDDEDALPDWVEPEALDDDGHYEPPPPPPVPRLAPKKLGAVAAIGLGLLLLFVPGVLDAFQLSRAGVSGFGLLLLLGGAAGLVYLMRDAPPGDSGPDDGAVV